MNDPEDDMQERGFLKSLILAGWSAFVWVAFKVEQLWKSEMFWWSVCIASGIVALLCLRCAIVK